MGESPLYGNRTYGGPGEGGRPAPVHAERCPQCSAPLPVPPPALCPQCQFPLLLAEPDERSSGVAEDLHRPSAPEVDDGTRLVPRTVPMQPEPVVVPDPPPTVPQMLCRACGWSNAAARIRCERCAALLRSDAPLPPPPPPAPLPPPRRSIPWWLAVLPVVLVALLAVVVVWFVVQRPWAPAPGSPTPPGQVTSAPPSPAGTPTTLGKIDSKTIKVTATSVLPPDPDSYAPDRTLDGDPRTAWNSDGKTLGANGRPTLTYTFAQPVRVGRIDVTNGFQKDDRVYQLNCRVKTLVVTVGAVSHTFTLTDSKAPQQLIFDFGTAETTVTVKVGDVYPGTKYRDIAISEVVFYGLT